MFLRVDLSNTFGQCQGSAKNHLMSRTGCARGQLSFPQHRNVQLLCSARLQNNPFLLVLLTFAIILVDISSDLGTQAFAESILPAFMFFSDGINSILPCQDQTSTDQWKIILVVRLWVVLWLLCFFSVSIFCFKFFNAVNSGSLSFTWPSW